MKATIKIVKQYDKHENTILLATTSSAFKDDQLSLTDFITILHHNSTIMKLEYDCHPPSGLREFNPIRAGGARTFFNRPFLQEKRGLEVPNFVTFPNSL